MIVHLFPQSMNDNKRVRGKARCGVFNRAQYASGLEREDATGRFPEAKIGYFYFVLAEHKEVEIGGLPIIINEGALLSRPGKEQLPLISGQPLTKVA